MAAFLHGVYDMIRIGTVTNVYPENGKVKVYYEDSESSSLPLPMMSMNKEHSMPEVGDTVVTLHLANGSSKGFCLGTYFDDDYSGGEKYIKECTEGEYLLKCEGITFESKEIILKCAKGTITLSEILKKLSDYDKRIRAIEDKA